MKKYSVLILILTLSVSLMGENNYLDSLFKKDKLKLYKEASIKLQKSLLGKDKKKYRICFIYGFDFTSSYSSYLSIGNAYLNELKPVYSYSNFCFLPNRRIALKKRLSAMGYIFNENDSIVGMISSLQHYPFKVFLHSDDYSRGVYRVFREKEFDLVFYVGFLSSNIWWCVKGDKTLIYNVDSDLFLPLEDFYKCCWKKYRPSDKIILPRLP